jgi:putative ABC transport system permease protein
MSLRQVPALSGLRRELGLPRGLGAAGYALGLMAISALVLWKAHDPKLGAYVLGGFAIAAAIMALLSFILLRLLAGVRADGGIGWRHGIANLRRHSLTSVLQIVAFGIGLMALLTMTLIRGDLMQSWQQSLRPDLPNRFIINIQPDQAQPLTEYFTKRGISPPVLYPMVRGRLIAVNNRSLTGEDYADERARRLIEREFNLSWMQAAPANRIVAGQWWTADDARSDQLSVEQGIAKTLKLKLGDALTYDVAGSTFTATITSIREVDWNSFGANFFVIGTPALLSDYPATYITSFYAPSQQLAVLNEAVRLFPNFVVIDVAQILVQLRSLIQQAGQAVQFVFLFTLAAGIAVLYAALSATRDEREYEAAVVRTLGASRRQIASTQFTEFAVMGSLAGLLAAAGASALGYVLARQVLDMPYFGTPWIWLWGVGGGTLVIVTAGMLGVRRVLETPPLQVLRRAAA